MANYYENVLIILKEKNISQAEFARMLNVPRNTLNQWIKGINEPPMEIIKRTAVLLNISIDKDIFQHTIK